MKFYFCEGCGRRVTELDIDAGAAKDKKLKGVYCKNCSAGVSTMNSLPLTDKQADKLLAEERKKPPSTVVTRRSSKNLTARSKSSSGHMRATRSARSSSDALTQVSDTSNTPWLMGIGGVAILLFGVIFFSIGSPGKVPKRNASTPMENDRDIQDPEPDEGDLTRDLTPKPDLNIKPEPVEPSPVEPPPLETEPVPNEVVVNETPREALALAEAKEAHAAGKFEIAWDLLSKLGATKEDATGLSEGRKRIEEFKTEFINQVQAEFQALKKDLEGPEAAKAAAQASKFSERFGAALTKVVGLEALLVEWAEKIETSRQANKLAKVAQARFMGVVKKFETAVLDDRLNDAIKLARAAQADNALASEKEKVLALAAVAETIEKTRLAKVNVRESALKKLVGKKVKLKTLKGERAGKVSSYKDNILSIEQQFFINGKLKGGAQFKVPVSELTPRQRAKLWTNPVPESPDEWMGLVVLAFVSQDADGAEKALASVATHPLRALYTERLVVLRVGAREAAAMRAWRSRIEPLIAKVSDPKGTKPEAKAGLKELDLFRASHGKTKFAATVAAKAVALEKEYNERLGPPKELTLDLGEGVKMEFIRVQPGTFMMGDDVQKDKSRLNNPVHKVTLTKGYYLGTFEVTFEQFVRVAGVPRHKQYATGNNRPICNVSWIESNDFCQKLAAKTGRKVRLPTEAEWEYACRAGSSSKFCYGDDSTKLVEYGWMIKNSGGTVHPIGKKKPNAWGFFDMHGNVKEWTSGWAGEITKEAVIDPKGPPSGKRVVVRGGSYNSTSANCRSGIRKTDYRGHRTHYDGLRVAIDF